METATLFGIVLLLYGFADSQNINDKDLPFRRQTAPRYVQTKSGMFLCTACMHPCLLNLVTYLSFNKCVGIVCTYGR